MQKNDLTSAEQNGFASNSFAKGLAVLEAFDAESPFLSMAEIARRTGQDRATARRGVLTLEVLGFLQRKGRLFALSSKVLIIAGNFLQATRLRAETLPILSHYASVLKTDLCLSTLVENQVLVLCHSAQQPGSQLATPEIGTTYSPFNCAMGRMLLSARSDDDLANLLKTTEVARRTPHSVTDPVELLERIKSARETGYAFEYGEHIGGFLSYALPVPLDVERPLALGMCRPIDSAPNAPVQTHLETLSLCARELSQLASLTAF